MPDLTPGTDVGGRYRIIERLGSGGMADVYLAEDSQLARRVALKLLHRRFAGDPQFVERFRQEAHSAAGLQHPNIVSVYDRGDWDGTAYIAMEYLPGRTLKDLIVSEAPLDPLRATSIAIQILQAAKFAHESGIIHRDLKPQNVMVSPEDQVKVTDFGIARAGSAGITEAGSIMGTAQYISPEQAQGADVGPRSDIYSVGVVLYEMLTGQAPFDAESPVAIALKQVTEEPRPPSSLQPGIPADLEALDLWALRKAEADRPADAGEFIRSLEMVAERLRAGEATTSTVAFAVPPAAAAAATTLAAAASEPEDPLDGDEEKQGRKGWWIAGGIAALLAIGIGVAALTGAFSSPAPQVTMPLVVGKKLQVATTVIANAGFKDSPSVQRVQSDKPRDTVINQNPLAYARVANDVAVTLVVSDGPGTTQIPPVQGLKQAEAEAALKKVGLKFVIRQQADPTIAQGYAIGTQPSSDASVEAGSQVVLLVSTGVEKVAVPDVVGSNVDDARSRLQQAGFVVTTVKQQTTTKPDGQVLSQSPGGGEMLSKGATVTLTVASQPSTVVIPNVVGLAQQAGVDAVNKAGLNATIDPNQVTTPDQTLDGTVATQSPAGGGQAPTGSTVKLTIYVYKP